MDPRENLADFIKKDSNYESDNRAVLQDGFKQIIKYFEPVKKQLENEKYSENDYSYDFQLTDNRVRIETENNVLAFFDYHDHISVEIRKPDLRKNDQLIIENNELKSKKYNKTLSNELLNKYLKAFL